MDISNRYRLMPQILSTFAWFCYASWVSLGPWTIQSFLCLKKNPTQFQPRQIIHWWYARYDTVSHKERIRNEKKIIIAMVGKISHRVTPISGWELARDHPHSVLHPLADKIFAPEIVLHTKKRNLGSYFFIIVLSLIYWFNGLLNVDYFSG